jgi:hypothetical protein
MSFVMFFPAYFTWHYSAALLSLFNIWRSLVWFTYHFFSVGLLLRTLFSPWRRLGEDYKKGSLDMESWFETLVVNSLMRVVGVIIRLVVVIVGLVCLALVSASLLPLAIIWLALPLGAFGLMAGGVINLI